MDKRQAIGSWLSGPREAAEEMGADFGYPGKQLGLPQQGPGSVARFGRRLGAVAIDWLGCQLIAYGLITGRDWNGSGNWTLAVFVALVILTVGTVGFTPGSGCWASGSFRRTAAGSASAAWCCAPPCSPC